MAIVMAYSKRWMEECKKFATEDECLMFTNNDGEQQCYFEPLGEYEDCETVWPTTTTTTRRRSAAATLRATKRMKFVRAPQTAPAVRTLAAAF